MAYVNTIIFFSGTPLSRVMATRKQEVIDQIRNYSETAIRDQLIEDVATLLRDRFRLTVPSLGEPEIESKDIDRPSTGAPGVATREQGTQYTMRIRFLGNELLFSARPEQPHHREVKGYIHGAEIVISRSAGPGNDQALKELSNDRDYIQERLRVASPVIDQFNAEIADEILQRLTRRRQKLLTDDNLIQKRGFKLRPRDKPVIVAPEKRQPPPTAVIQRGDPAISQQAYEEILETSIHMALVMERHPQAFARLEHEEHFRCLFLFGLNGNYKGQATGETFNYGGKTDILIIHQGKNIFIAECKFWKGRTKFVEGVDQLLGYVSWRDTKTALFVFNRGTKMSTVLERIPKAIEAHPCFLRHEPYDCEFGFRCTLTHPDDDQQRISLTILVFNIPNK